MSIMGYYDGTAVQVDKPLQMNQKVIIIPIESEKDLGESAAGGLHKYADVLLRALEIYELKEFSDFLKK